MLWSETRKVPIISKLQQDIASLEESIVAESNVTKVASLKAVIVELRNEIKRRQANPSFIVELRHMGTPEAPLRLRELQAEGRSIDHRADQRARKAIQQDGDVVTPVTVMDARARDPEFIRDLSYHARTWLLETLVGGESEYHRLANLGGPDLILHAFREAQAFQTLSDETKNG